jgi:hypothetical protein
MKNKLMMSYICVICFFKTDTNADYEKHLDICQPNRVKMTDRKNIKIGNQWFDMLFFSDGTIEKFCISYTTDSNGKRIAIPDCKARVSDWEEEWHYCKNCDWNQAS